MQIANFIENPYLCVGVFIYLFIMEKKCSKCGEIKSVDLYRKDSRYENRYRAMCKTCESKRENDRRISNLDKYAEKARLYRKNNPDKVKKHENIRRIKHADKISAYNKTPDRIKSKKEAIVRLKEKDPDYYARYNRNRRATDKQFCISNNLRNRVSKALKGITKGISTLDLLGCTIPELKKHLEERFLPTMTWENYGTVWHIDHKKPCASFDLTVEAEQRECFHYTNLQPLFAVTTIIDGVEYIGNLEKSDKLIF